MDEEKDIQDLEEEKYEDLDEMEEFQLEMQEMNDMVGLEDIPEEENVGISQSDVIITYQDKIIDETEELEKNYNKLIEQVKEGEIISTIERALELLIVGKRLEAHYLTAKISTLIATLFTSEKKHTEATEYYLQAVTEARKSDDKKLHLLSLSAFGRNLKNFDLKDAAVVFNQARELAQELNENEYFAENSVELANCLFNSDRDNSYKLYQDNVGFFENLSDYRTISRIRYRLGLIDLVKKDYQTAVMNLQKAKTSAQNISDLPEADDIVEAFKFSQNQLKKGKALLHSLKLPKPEPVEETPGTKKIFEIYTSTGIVDIINRIEKKQLKLIDSKRREVDEMETICDENKITRLNDTDILEFSKLYEEVGDIYLKEGKSISTFYNYLGSQLLALHTSNMKRADKLEKKLEKIIESIVENEEDDNLYFDMMMYKNRQIAQGIRERNQKLSTSYADKGLEIAKKRNNPLYEGLFKEIIADVKSLTNENKAQVEYQAVITLCQELENYICLMRIYEKMGNIFLFSQTEKAKEYLNNALKIAQELEDEEVILRLEGKL